MQRYDPAAVEAKWQKVWDDAEAFITPNPEPGEDASRMQYVLEMLPYPSGDLHMGHVKNYTIGDALCHQRRRHGLRVLHPMGYDAFGLPAENAAIREGRPPRDVTNENIVAIRKQMKRMGWSIDWSRELSTAEPEFYRWTQWIFLQLFERGLAYKNEAPVNWCPVDQTVLANEQVIDGHCERCGALVESRVLAQWYFKITDYAQRLLDDMALLEDWPERVLTMQRNWIGRSEGAEVLFHQRDLDESLPVFTTRPDTLFGATFFVMAPEHPLIPRLVAGTEHEAAVLDYVRHHAAHSEEERAQDKEKSGVDTGRTITNPVTGEEIPIWVADYVLMGYGTGAVMAVPAHDERDFEFARKHGLPIVPVIAPAGGEPPEDEAYTAHTADEVMINSGPFTGLPADEAYTAIVGSLAERGVGHATIHYRLRDWLISRQRYWGCPIPIISCPSCGLVPGARRSIARRAAGDRGLPAQGTVTACDRHRLGQRPVPEVRRRCEARDRHHGHVHVLVLVLHPLRRSARLRGGLEPGGRRSLAARRPVHRRRRARDPAPALLALLHEGLLRRRPGGLQGAVQAPVHTGHDLQGRRQDVQVEGQRRGARRAGRPLRRRFAAPLRAVPGPARGRRRVDGRRHRRLLSLPAAAVGADRRAGRGRRARDAVAGLSGRPRARPGKPWPARRTGRSTSRRATPPSASTSTPPWPRPWSCSTRSPRSATPPSPRSSASRPRR